MDVSIIGAAGTIGRAIALSLVRNRILPPTERLQLVAHKEGGSKNSVEGLAADLADAYAEQIPDIDVAVDPEQVLGDVIIMAAGATVPTDPALPIDRNALARNNYALFEMYAKAIRKTGHGEELVLVVSNPVELGVHVFSKHLDNGPRRVFGMGAYLDSLRFRKEIASDLGVRRQAVQGFVLGQHGPCMVPCWSTVSVFGFDSDEGGERLKALRRRTQPKRLDEIARETAAIQAAKGTAAAYRHLSRYGPEVRTYVKPFVTHQSGARTSLGTAEMTLRLVETILKGEQAITAVQVALSGEFHDIHGVTGVPAVISAQGVLRVEHLDLYEEEVDGIKAAAAQSQALIENMENA